MKFLAFTDMHYSDLNDLGERRHNLSLEKVKKAIKSHSDGCDFIINLGDTADSVEGLREQTVLWKETADAMKESGLPSYSLIGNHDTSTDKETWVKTFNMSGRYYSFDVDRYKIIVLDPNTNNPHEPMPKKEIEWEKCYIDDEQKEWLKNELNDTDKPIFIFCHELFVLENAENENEHLIINRKEIIDMFEKSGKVKGVFAGHYHYGDFAFVNSIPYITLKSICLNLDDAHSVVTIDEKSIKIDGYGTQESYICETDTISI